MNVDTIHARYLPTPKNKPCPAFWIQSGFVADESETLFCLNLEKPTPNPDLYGSEQRMNEQLAYFFKVSFFQGASRHGISIRRTGLWAKNRLA